MSGLIKKIYRKLKKITVRTKILFGYRKIIFLERDSVGILSKRIKIPKFLYDRISGAYIEKILRNFRFVRPENPKFSIIIPVYNNFVLTLKCLDSISKIDMADEAEIIIIDDASSDRTQELIPSIRGISYIRSDRNRGFILSCNAAAMAAKGEYLIFLNNDTEVDKRWLAELATTFQDNENIGLVGSKLIYPDGRLQEAGGIVWSDGSAANWLHKSDPRHPACNYLRDVDYVTGASIMIERGLFERLGCFDERYQHSYYEDTDLAMAVRKAGLRVVYQPMSIVIHHEGASSGKSLSTGAKRYQAINREIFFDKWSEDLKAHFSPSDRSGRASDRQSKGDFLIIDSITPTPDKDSGSVDMYHLIRILLDIGYRVHFIPSSNLGRSGVYTQNLQKIGVKCIYAPYYSSVDKYLKGFGGIFDFVLMARNNVAHGVINAVGRHCPDAKTIFYTVDLHFLREMREAEIADDPKKKIAAERTKEVELSLMDRVDATIVLSNVEKDMLEKWGKQNLFVLPLIRKFPELTKSDFAMRSGIIFIGGFNHKPNLDAVKYLVNEVWPEFRRQLSDRNLPAVKLGIYGSNMPDRLREYQCDDIDIHGYVADLAPCFEGARLSIAPLRYGAGLKGKLATSFGFGVPVIGSTIAYEGVDIKSRSIACVDSGTPSEYAEKIINLYYNQQLWNAVSDEVSQYARTAYGYDSAKSKVSELLEIMGG